MNTTGFFSKFENSTNFQHAFALHLRAAAHTEEQAAEKVAATV